MMILSAALIQWKNSPLMIIALFHSLKMLAFLLGVPLGLALLLQWIGGGIRKSGVSRLGNAYWYLVSPGVACHETGHALGCLLTFCRITKFVPFRIGEDGTLGYVQHEVKSGWKGAVSNLVIATGPIWFGCIVIVSLTWLFAGTSMVANYGDYFSNDALPGLLDYIWACFKSSKSLLFSLGGDSFSSWWLAALWFYLVFCVASEIGLSSVDIASMWRGLLCVVAVLLLSGMIPVMRAWYASGLHALLPRLFLVHSLMAFAVLIDSALWLLMRLFVRR